MKENVSGCFFLNTVYCHGPRYGAVVLYSVNITPPVVQESLADAKVSAL